MGPDGPLPQEFRLIHVRSFTSIRNECIHISGAETNLCAVSYRHSIYPRNAPKSFS